MQKASHIHQALTGDALRCVSPQPRYVYNHIPGFTPRGFVRFLLTAAVVLCSSSLTACSALAQTRAAARPGPLPSLAQPSLSPDGKEIAFVSGGDIWTVPAAGGEAHLLVSDPADESRPLYSPDGSRLAFNSTRTGGNDLYVLTFATGQLQRITFSDSASSLDAWSHDGQWLYFTSGVDDISNQGDIFRVRATGGTPLEVSAERYMAEFESAPSPDGKEVALVAKGISASQWWRDGHAHIDETEIWLKPLSSSAADGGYRKLLAADSKHAWPMWTPDGKSLLYMCDRTAEGNRGGENIWEADAASGSPKQLTHFTSGRVLWPTLSYDGRTVVFERHFAIWKMDTRTGKAEQVPIALRGLPSGPHVEHTAVSGWSGLALSPDGRKIALVGHGEIFAAAASSGGEAQRVTRTGSEERSPKWNGDSTEVAYTSERDGGSALYAYNFNTDTERALVRPPKPASDLDLSPSYSPDGKLLAFIRNRREVHVLTLAGMHDKVVASGEIDSTTLAWSPDSKWLVYLPNGSNSFTNLWAVPTDGSAAARQITFLANGETGGPIAWAPDGKYILFATAQRAETSQLARVDLVPHVPVFREDQFRDLFRRQSTPGAPDSPENPTDNTPRPRTDPQQPTTPDTPAADLNQDLDPGLDSAQEPAQQPAAPPPGQTPPDHTPEQGPGTRGRGGRPGAPPRKPAEPTRIVFEGIRQRLTLLPLEDLGIRSPVISPDGKTLAFLADVAGQQNIYTYSLDENSREPATPRQLTTTPGFKSSIAFAPDSQSIYYMEGGGGRGGPAPGGGEGGAGVRMISIATRIAKPINVTASIDVDFDDEKVVVFNEAWSTLDHQFFRADFNGADWTALKSEWAPYIAGARTGPELRRDINLLIGELNTSHSGISRAALPSVRTGRLGLRFDRAPFEATGALVVREIIPLGPAALAGANSSEPANPANGIHIGDHILAVDGTPLTPSTNLDQLLEDRANHRVVLSVAPGGNAGKKHDVPVRPVTTQVESGLLYRAWVESRRSYVEKVSGGKLGYVHLAAMGDNDLAQLYVDLDAANQAKQGVVVDVRNNNGGYVNGRVIDVFARKNYLIGTPRDGSPMPMRQGLGQRALGLPTVLVTNESTLSDGEDFTEGYRALQLGKVVGAPTAGWIIFTGSQRLIDGSQVRVPGDRIKTLEGKDMEFHARPVDVEVLRTLGETETGTDKQLDSAVQTLLSQLK